MRASSSHGHVPGLSAGESCEHATSTHISPAAPVSEMPLSHQESQRGHSQACFFRGSGAERGGFGVTPHRLLALGPGLLSSCRFDPRLLAPADPT